MCLCLVFVIVVFLDLFFSSFLYVGECLLFVESFFRVSYVLCVLLFRVLFLFCLFDTLLVVCSFVGCCFCCVCLCMSLL